jgi:DNA uptake protein ComE-like DNA-binding protein
VLDANTATAEQLAGAEGVSEELAAAIAAGQPYASVTDLNAKLLETLSAEEAAAVLTNVFVPVNLNSGTEEEIRLIPGMTDKMVHEFEEYRPYADMGVFDREIGKYVDEAEVERFKNYVTL